MEDFQRMNTDDRVFSFKVKPNFKKGTSMVDPRLAEGKNRLHAYQDGATCLWFLQYDHGNLPEPLRGQRYTRFESLEQAVRTYYGNRGYDVFLNAPVEKHVETSGNE